MGLQQRDVLQHALLLLYEHTAQLDREYPQGQLFPLFPGQGPQLFELLQGHGLVAGAEGRHGAVDDDDMIDRAPDRPITVAGIVVEEPKKEEEPEEPR